MSITHLSDPTATDRFRSLVRATYPDVRLYALRRLDPADADDVVSETYAIAWRKWADPPPTDPRPWLFGIARNVIRNQRRGLRRMRRLQDALPAPAHHPDGSAAFEAGEQLLHALSRLREPDREILQLAAWEGLGTAEIAEALACSPEAAATRLHRARARLASELGEENT